MENEFELWKKITPGRSVVLWRIIALLFLSIIWIIHQGNELAFLLLFFFIIIELARWRFNLSAWTIFLDLIVCFLIIPHWAGAWYALMIPVFEAALLGKGWFAFPILIFIIFFPSQISFIFLFMIVQAFLSAAMLYSWKKQLDLYQSENNLERRDRYKLVKLKDELLLANQRVARMAELAERNRIAQDLHDHVGHELTASLLALQAFEQLWQEDEPQAEDLFLQLKKRLSDSVIKLRETVHDMKPVEVFGVDSLKKISDGFTLFPVKLEIYGDSTRVLAYLWSILEVCLKEALNNVYHHSEANKVEVTLDVSTYIVRLSVFNDGTYKQNSKTGIGLRNLRQRAQAVGGSVSIDRAEGFRLICVLPLNSKGDGSAS